MALQEVWTAPTAEFLRRRKDSFSTSAGTASYGLASNLIEMLGPVYTPSRPLTPVNNRSDFLAFTDRFLPADATAATGEPVAYYLERLNSSNTDPDPVTVNLLITPTPQSAVTVSYEAAFEPPNLTECDLDSDDTVIPIPHSWLESILLPIAMWHLQFSHWYDIDQHNDTREALKNKYALARQQLGLSDPQINSVKLTQRPLSTPLPD